MITETTSTLRDKGALIAVSVCDKDITFWYASPTGDSTDSLLFTMRCLSNAQALIISERHGQAWRRTGGLVPKPDRDVLR